MLHLLAPMRVLWICAYFYRHANFLVFCMPVPLPLEPSPTSFQMPQGSSNIMETDAHLSVKSSPCARAGRSCHPLGVHCFITSYPMSASWATFTPRTPILASVCNSGYFWKISVLCGLYLLEAILVPLVAGVCYIITSAKISGWMLLTSIIMV